MNQMITRRDYTYILVWILLQQIITNSAVYYTNGKWNWNTKTDCSRRCVRPTFLCDGIPHCTDGSDEENCVGNCSATNTFHCKNERCIPIYLRCDGYDDCWDESDEQNCTDPITKFNNREYDVPIKIEHIDAEHHKIRNFSYEISMNKKFEIPMIGFKVAKPDQELDARTIIFEHMRKVVFYIHGFNTDDLNDGQDMKNALIGGVDDIDCIIIVDWRHGSYFDHGWLEWYPWHHYHNDYITAATENVPVVSNYLTCFIHEMIPKNVEIHLIGFSLGGQITGLTGRTVQYKYKRTIRRISAIDPAGPIFEYGLGIFTVDTTNTLRSTDAQFVDVIHASSVLGMINKAGHIDFYIEDIDCTLPSCLHHKAFDVYLASIVQCSQISCPKQKQNGNNCLVSTSTELSSLGYLADLYDGRGEHSILFFIYDLSSKTQKYSTGICSPIYRIDLSAKYRICHKPPTATSNCRFKPYLWVCNENCDGNNIATSKCTQETKEQYKVMWSGERCLRPIGCLNEDGNQVKYFIAYKLPNSLDYIYTFRSTDFNTVEWKKGSKQISDPKSVLGLTLSPLYEQVTSITFIAWNDDMPFDSKKSILLKNRTNGNVEAFSESNGHSKGVVAYNEMGGFLLSHSIPRFPSNPDLISHYEYPDSGRKFAQMAVCVTSTKFDLKNRMFTEMAALLDLMTHFKPQVYMSNVFYNWPLGIRNKFEKLIHPGSQALGAPFIGNALFGQNFVNVHSFGRSHKHIFVDSFKVLAEYYDTSIVAQTWERDVPNGQNSLPSFCNVSFTVENINKLKVWDNIKSNEWCRTNDHSKWIASTSNEKPVICVGDLNRARSTISRGGFFICIKDEALYRFFNSYVTYELESCPTKAGNSHFSEL